MDAWLRRSPAGPDRDSGAGGTEQAPTASEPGEVEPAADPLGQRVPDPEAEADMGADMTMVAGSVIGTDCADALDEVMAQRTALIEMCLYAMDRARSAGVVERLTEGLRGVGVCAVRPEGERFDPAVHEAAGTVGTDDPALDGMIAEIEVVGFVDRDTVLRAPVVTVYQHSV